MNASLSDRVGLGEAPRAETVKLFDVGDEGRLVLPTFVKDDVTAQTVSVDNVT